MTAASEGHISIVRLFLQHNANTELKDSQGWKASDHAVIHGHHRLGKQLLFWLRDAGIPLQSGHVVSLWFVSPTSPGFYRVVKISQQLGHFTGYFEYCAGYSEC